MSRLTGWGLPLGDPLLVTVSIALLIMCLFAGEYLQRLPATALLFAAFVFVSLAEIALMVRGQPSDIYFDPFS